VLTTISPNKQVDHSAISVRTATPRRSYSLEFKLAVLEQTRVPGTSVAVVARENGINANVVFGWRKLLRESRLVPGQSAAKILVPVVITDSTATPDQASRTGSDGIDSHRDGLIRIELPRDTVSVSAQTKWGNSDDCLTLSQSRTCGCRIA
jgi:transposase